MKPHTTYRKSGPSSFNQEDFFFKFAYISLCKKLTFPKKDQGQSNVTIFFQTLLGPRPQCCIPSPRAIVLLVPEKKIFKRFLPCMDLAAILVMCSRCGEQTFVPRATFIWNLAFFGPMFSEMLEECGRRTGGRTGSVRLGAYRLRWAPFLKWVYFLIRFSIYLIESGNEASAFVCVCVCVCVCACVYLCVWMGEGAG